MWRKPWSITISTIHSAKHYRKNGYKVIFKRRPKSLSWEGINIFNGLKNVEILYNHFEEPGTAELADAFIIQYGGSSTFYWTICTNKTLIYVDAGWESWFPDVYELIEKKIAGITSLRV